jgi:predicted acylesterase/phospholipase RssA/CRP-like cAMP-binding protein
MSDAAAMAADADAAAASALAGIDARAGKVLHQLRRAIAVFLGDNDGGRPEPSGGTAFTAHDLDLAVASWKDLVPNGPDPRAALLHAVVERSGISCADYPVTAAVLGVGDGPVEEAFLRRYGSDIATAIAAVPASSPHRDAGPGPALSGGQLLELERAFTRVALEAGDVLFHEGDQGDSLYVVVSGRVRMVVGTGDQERSLRDLGAGELLGEMALLTGEPRAATIVAVRDTELYRLGSESVERHLLGEVAVIRRIMTTLARRLAGTLSASSAVQPTVRSIALVPAGAMPVEEVSNFAEKLGRFLAEHVRAAVFSASSVEQILGAGTASSKEGAASAGLAGWLTDQEDRHDVTLYAPEASPWASGSGLSAGGGSHFWERLCVRQADVVLLVGRAGSDPRPGPAEQRLPASSAATGARRELVLLHKHAGEGSWATQQWLDQRQLSRAHHVMADDRGHLGRLSRFLVGRPVGLVLSGGGVRGFGHVGVLKALQEQGIPVDVICATSAGAVVGAEYAMGWSCDELEQRNLEMFAVPRRQILDYTLPTTSIVGSVALNRVLTTIFGDRRIEDLWAPYLCTISDLTAAELVVRGSGPLRDAIRASCSLPVLLPPVVGANGHLLADGGILNNLPVMPLLSRMTVGTLVLVNVTSPFYTADEPYDYSDSMPLWRVLNGRFNPLARRLVAPGIGQVLLRALEMGTKSLEPEQIARADVYIRPHFDSASYTDTSRLPAVLRAGYEAAQQVLSGWDTSSIPFR